MNTAFLNYHSAGTVHVLDKASSSLPRFFQDAAQSRQCLVNKVLTKHTKKEVLPLCTNCFPTGNHVRQINRLITCEMQQLAAPSIARLKRHTPIYKHSTDPLPSATLPVMRNITKTNTGIKKQECATGVRASAGAGYTAMYRKRILA